VRIEIADLRHAGLGVGQIAVRVGGAPSTISLGLRRNVAAAGNRRSRRTAAPGKAPSSARAATLVERHGLSCASRRVRLAATGRDWQAPGDLGNR
jgi:IS30 family transposase